MTERQMEVCGLLKAGLTYKEIENRTGYDQHNARKLALRLGLAYTDEARRAEQLERVRTVLRSHGAEYIDGYVNNTSVIKIRLDCGHERRMRWTSVIDVKDKGEKIRCDECRKLMEKPPKPPKPPKLKTIKGKQMEFRSCAVCGGIVIGTGKYCSDQCRNKAENKSRETRRRQRIRGTKRDAGITVEALYRRDGGICHLCGGQCDFDDYTKDGDNFIVGATYPSIDHVIPLSKGGSHVWENVKLAHHRCNTIKGNRYPRPD